MVNCYCIRRPAVFFSSLFCSSFGGGFVASREMEMGSYLCTWAVSFRRRPNLLDQGGTFLTGTQSFLSSSPFRNQCHHVLALKYVLMFLAFPGGWLREESTLFIFHSVVRSHYLSAVKLIQSQRVLYMMELHCMRKK